MNKLWREREREQGCVWGNRKKFGMNVMVGEDGVGRDGGEPSLRSLDGTLGHWVTNGFKCASDMIRFPLTIILEKSLWL